MGVVPRGADVDVAVEKALLPHALQLWSVFVILEASEREPPVSICVSGNGRGCCKLTTQHVEKSFSGLVWGRQRWGARHASPLLLSPLGDCAVIGDDPPTAAPDLRQPF